MIAYSVTNIRCALNNAVETFIQDFMTTGGAITFAISGSLPCATIRLCLPPARRRVSRGGADVMFRDEGGGLSRMRVYRDESAGMRGRIFDDDSQRLIEYRR